MIEIIGYIAGFFTSIPLFPQIYKSYKTKSTKDLSSLFILFEIIGSTLWITYGFLNSDVPLLISSILFLFS